MAGIWCWATRSVVPWRWLRCDSTRALPPGSCLEDPALAIFDPDQALHQLGQQFGVEGTIEWVAHHNPTWHPEDVRIKVEALKETSHQVTEAIVRQNEPWNVMAELAALTIPTLVLGADPELGALVPPALGESLRRIE